MTIMELRSEKSAPGNRGFFSSDCTELNASDVPAKDPSGYLPGFSDFAVSRCFCNVSIWPEAYSPAASFTFDAFLYSAISFLMFCNHVCCERLVEVRAGHF